MQELQCHFVIEHHPSHQGQPQLLESTGDPNAATVVFDRELWRLRKQGRAGEVVLLRCDERRTIVLRQPLVIQRVARQRPWERVSA